MSQRYADPGEQLVDPERLRHVIVRTEVERAHLVSLAAARGEHDDGRPRTLADVTDDLEPIPVRQVDVENDEVGGTAVVARLRLARRLRGLDLEPVPAKVRPKRAHHGRLVVHDEQPRAGRLGARSASRHLAGLAA